MFSLQNLIDFLDTVFPPLLAEEWDNTGLLLGDRSRLISSVMTCLTVTPETAREAVSKKADLVISHHPFPFRTEKRWTSDTVAGTTLLTLVSANIAVYSPHTAHDSALCGINRQLAERLGLTDVSPMIPAEIAADKAMLAGLDDAWSESLDDELGTPLGSGRIGLFETPVRLSDLLRRVRAALNLGCLAWVGEPEQRIETLAVACGAADSFIPAAIRSGADAMLLGETKFHQALEAKNAGLALILPGHFATERFAMETLAERISRRFSELSVWTSENESDPFRFDFRQENSMN